MPAIKELLDSRRKLVEDNRALIKKAESEGRNVDALNTEEAAEYDRRDAEIDTLSNQIDAANAGEQRRQRLAKYDGFGNEPPTRQTAPASVEHASGAASARRGSQEPLTFQLRNRQITINPASREAERCSSQYRQNFLQYILTGEREKLGLHTASDPKGGYLAPMANVMQLIKFLDDTVFMRQLANVLPPISSAVSLGAVSYDTDVGDADWTPEVPASDISEDDNAAFGRREMTPHLDTKLVKFSRKLARTSMFDIDSFLVGRQGYKHGVAEEKAFMTGNGNHRPLGVFVASNDGISTGRDKSASSTTDFTPDDLIDALYNLKEQYINQATLLTSREFIKRCRKKKDGNGQYLWQPGMQGGQPSTVLDRPYVMSEFVPSTFTTGQYVALWGAFKVGYWIVDSLELEIQRLDELFSLKNQLGILSRKETDGQPVLEEAFSRMILA